MNSYQDWRAKLESAYSLMVHYCKNTVWKSFLLLGIKPKWSDCEANVTNGKSRNSYILALFLHCLDASRLRRRLGLFSFTSGLPRVKGKINSQTSHESPFGFPTSHKWQSHKWQVGNQNGPWVKSFGIITVTSPQPRGIIIPIVSENLPSKVRRKALAMSSFSS